MDNTRGIDLGSWYRIGTPESHTYERAECYPYAGFFFKLFKKDFFSFVFSKSWTPVTVEALTDLHTFLNFQPLNPYNKG